MSPSDRDTTQSPAQVLLRVGLRSGVVLAGQTPGESMRPRMERHEARILEQTETGWLLGFAPGAVPPFEQASRLALELRAAVPPVAIALHAPCVEPPERTRDLMAHVEAIARPGEALATEAFRRLAKERYAFEPLAEGIFRLGNRREALGEAFVGREAELRHLRSCWETARLGRPLVVCLQGAPGIGKSRLLTEFLRDHPGALVACSREHERQRPYALLSSFIAALGLHPGRLGSELGSEAADLDYLLGIEAPGGAVQPRHRQFRAFKALNRVVLERLGAIPTVLALEDLHWADEASLAWLDSLMAELSFTEASPPWLFVMTERGNDLYRRYAGMGLGAVAVRLEPLPEPMARELIETIAPRVEAAMRDKVLDRSAGNPLFLREFARLAADAGTVDVLPDSLRWELRRRLESRTLPERQVLEMAAILGASFELALLERLVEVTGFRQLLANLAGANLLTLSGERGAFSHHLLYEASYEAVPIRRRQELHGMVAHLLQAEDDDPGRLAHHLLRSTRPAQARPYLLRAAESARRGHALQQARDHLLRAREAGSEADALAQTVRLELAEVLLTLGELEAARRELATVRPIVPDDERVRLALLMAQLDERRGDYSSAIAYLHEGHAAAGQSAERARLLLAEASLRLRRGEFAACRDLAAEAHGLLSGEPSLDRALAHSLEGIATYRLEGPEQALTAYREALRLREAMGDPAAIAGSHSNLGVAYYELGRWDEAHEAFERALETFRSVGERWQSTVVLNNMGHLKLNRGAYEEAERCYRETLVIKREMGEEPGVAIALCNLGNALSRRELYDEARASLLEAVLILERLGEQETLAEVYQVHGMVELAAGEADTARRLLDRVLDRSRALGREVPRAIALRGLSQLAAREGRWHEAREHAWESVQLNDRVQNPLELGRSLVALGIAYRALGEEVRATDALGKALVLFDRLGALPDKVAVQALLA